MRKIKFKCYKRYDKTGEIHSAIHEVVVAKYSVSTVSTHSNAYTIIGYCQFTGLKDKNGVEIYEGDILKYNFEDDTHDYMPVFFKDGSFMTGKKDEEYLFDDLDPKHGFRIEVAGNIYEHAHLLEL